MSNQDPGTEAQLDQDIAVPAPRARGGGKRYLAAFAAAAVCIAGVGGAVWAWQSFMAQGAQPAEALPAGTLAYAALDLDPPGGQKVAAYNELRKFPSLKRELGLGSVDDVQKSVVQELSSGGGCDVSFSRVQPWLGNRVAAAVVDQKKPEGVLVLQVTDVDQARAGLEKLSGECGFGFALHGDWALLARNEAVATQVERDTERGTLAGHGDYKRLTSAAGSAGLVTLYAAPASGQALLDVIDDDPFAGYAALQMLNGALDPATSFVMTFGLLAVAQPVADSEMEAVPEPEISPELKARQEALEQRFAHFEELTKPEQKQLMAEQDKLFEEIYGSMDDFASEGEVSEEDVFPTPKIDPALRESLKRFTGAGGVGRIADGALEVELVGDELRGTTGDMYAGDQGGDRVSGLPKSTAIAFGAGFADGWVGRLFGQLDSQYLYASSSEAEITRSFEKSTGLDVPADLEALGGTGASVFAGPGFSLEDLDDDTQEHTPVAARITGDPDKIEAALDKIRAHLGADGSRVLSKRAGNDVVVSADADFLDDVVASGGLGGTDTFRTAVPEADRATTVLFLNFDAGNWLVEQSARSDRADAEPLHALGLSVAKEDGQQRVVLRLTFDG